jgi:hypothetical protein
MHLIPPNTTSKAPTLSVARPDVFFGFFSQRRGALRRTRSGSAGCSPRRSGWWPGGAPGWLWLTRRPRGVRRTCRLGARGGGPVGRVVVARGRRGVGPGGGVAVELSQRGGAPWDIRQDIAASSSSSTASSRRRPRGRGRAGAALSSSRRSPSALSPTAAASPTAGLPRCLPYSSLLLPSRPFAPDPAVARAPLLRRRAAAWVARRPQATGARRPAAFGRSRCFPGLRVDF